MGIPGVYCSRISVSGKLVCGESVETARETGGTLRWKVCEAMGQHNVQEFDQHKSQLFMKAVLGDLRALAFMLENNLVESNVRRLGAEQEMFLVDADLRPAPLSLEVLQKANDDRLTTEIARFNLEANLTPRLLTRDCFSRMKDELNTLIAKTRGAANDLNADVSQPDANCSLQRIESRGYSSPRRPVLDSHQRIRRTPDYARQHHDGVVQYQFSDPLSNQRERIRFSLQCGAGHNGAGPGGRGKLTFTVRPAVVAGNKGRPIPAFNRCALRSGACSQPSGAGQLWRCVAQRFGNRALPRSDFSLSSDHDYATGRRPISSARARGRSPLIGATHA